MIPLAQQLPTEGPNTNDIWNHISDWTLRVPVQDRHVVLFGCTEDVKCTNPTHEAQHEKELQTKPFHCRTLCTQCTVPICSLCSSGLHAFSARSTAGTIPMALANDNFYGYVKWVLVSKRVTWLELACASICWSTILVCVWSSHVRRSKWGERKDQSTW